MEAKAKREVRVVSRIHLPEAAAACFRLDQLERALIERGETVNVITAKPAPIDANKPLRAGLKIKTVSVKRDGDGYVKGYLSYLSFDLQAFFVALFAPKASAMVVEPPPTTGVMMRLVSRLRRTPYIWYAADIWSDATAATGATKPVVRAVNWMEKFTLRGAAGVIAVSAGVAERAKQLGAKNIAVIPNGADTDTFNPEAANAHMELENQGVKRPYFIYAGTASAWQGAEVLARGFAEFWAENPDYQCVFLARGESFAKLQEIAGELAALAAARGVDYQPLLVKDLVAPAQAATWQARALAALVSIVPGQGYDFAYPTKILTALGCGAPVLFAGIGPASEDIREHDLGVVSDYEVAAVAQALGEVAKIGAERQIRERLAAWVKDHRSQRESGRQAAEFVSRLQRL